MGIEDVAGLRLKDRLGLFIFFYLFFYYKKLFYSLATGLPFWLE